MSWSGRRVCVAGSRVVGGAAARVLMSLGAAVTVVDEGDGPDARARAEQLEAAGARVLLGPAADVPTDAELLVVSPGFPPGSRPVRAAVAAGIPVWGDVQLALRLREEKQATGAPVPDWLCVTGTNGKTTTVRMLESILEAAGLQTVACGNAGLPLFEAATGPYDVLAVELSSFQLHYSRHHGEPLRAEAAAVLNIADDHLDWHGDLDAYSADKGWIFSGARRACVVGADDPRTSALATEGRTAGEFAGDVPVIPFRSGDAPAGGYGVRNGRLVGPAGEDLGAVSDVRPAGAHNVANALAAAALARAYGVPAGAVRDGLQRFRPDPHRIAVVAEVAGVTYVDDSKATNPAAAAASLGAFPDVVWIAGGLAKGARFDELVTSAQPHLRAVVLLGRDRAEIAGSLSRHAPEVPVMEVAAGDPGVVQTSAQGRSAQGGSAQSRSAQVRSTLGTSAHDEASTGEAVMTEAVRLASSVARTGSTVLLAPACASMDQFRDYTHRGEAFARAVARVQQEAGGGGPAGGEGRR